MMQDYHLDVSAGLVAALLRDTGKRLVLAESCTGGLVSATLARIPGISDVLCGSAVVYRNATKSAWLGIDPTVLDDPHIGPVSSKVTRDLAIAVLRRTSEAHVSAAVTGHLGPHAPPALDGIIHVAVAERIAGTDEIAIRYSAASQEDVSDGADPIAVRADRQQAAAAAVLLGLSRAMALQVDRTATNSGN